MPSPSPHSPTDLILRFVVMDRSKEHSDSVVGSATTLLSAALMNPGEIRFRLKKGFSSKLLTDRNGRPSSLLVLVSFFFSSFFFFFLLLLPPVSHFSLSLDSFLSLCVVFPFVLPLYQQVAQSLPTAPAPSSSATPRSIPSSSLFHPISVAPTPSSSSSSRSRSRFASPVIDATSIYRESRSRTTSASARARARSSSAKRSRPPPPDPPPDPVTSSNSSFDLDLFMDNSLNSSFDSTASSKRTSSTWAKGVIAPSNVAKQRDRSQSGFLGRGKKNSTTRDPLHAIHSHLHSSTIPLPDVPSPPPASIRRRVLLRAFILVDSHRRGCVTASEITAFGRFMGRRISPDALLDYAETDDDTNELFLEQNQFVDFSSKEFAVLSNDDFVDLLEGYLETLVCGAHKMKVFRTIFDHLVVPCYQHRAKKELRVGTVVLKEFGNVFVASAATSAEDAEKICTDLESLHPDTDLMWCRFLGHYSKCVRDVNDNEFTTIVDEFYDGWEDRWAQLESERMMGQRREAERIRKEALKIAEEVSEKH